MLMATKDLDEQAKKWAHLYGVKKSENERSRQEHANQDQEANN